MPTALGVHGGPLPERTVRALGVALAETLAILHGQGLTFVGVSPATVWPNRKCTRPRTSTLRDDLLVRHWLFL
ncbi:hypothetical protein [Streptomyces sp. NPDC001450]